MAIKPRDANTSLPTYPDLQNKVALVTGGSSGIGLACARAFARQGARVVIANRNEGRAKAALKGLAKVGDVQWRAIGFQLDEAGQARRRGDHKTDTARPDRRSRRNCRGGTVTVQRCRVVRDRDDPSDRRRLYGLTRHGLLRSMTSFIPPPRPH